MLTILVGIMLALLFQPIDGRRHRYGLTAAHNRRASQQRKSFAQVLAEDEEKDDEEEGEETQRICDFDDSSLKSIQRASRRRDPDAITPEPYVMLGGLWLSVQVFR